MPRKFQTATKTAVATQTKVLVAVVAVAALGLAAVGYGFGFGTYKSAKISPVATRPTTKPIAKPPSGNTVGGVEQITPSHVPVFEKLALNSQQIINNSDLNLYRFKLSTEINKTVTVKQLVFSFDLSYNAASSVTPAPYLLGDLRLRKGNTDIKQSDYEITCPTCSDTKDVKNGKIISPADKLSGLLVVTFNSEEYITGSGNIYALHGKFSNVSPGSFVKIALYRSSSQAMGNGYLTNNAIAPFTAMNANIVNIDMTMPPKPSGNSADLPGLFVWSVSSTPDHSYMIGGSPDWFNDLKIESAQLTEELMAKS